MPQFALYQHRECFVQNEGVNALPLISSAVIKCSSCVRGKYTLEDCTSIKPLVCYIAIEMQCTIVGDRTVKCISDSKTNTPGREGGNQFFSQNQSRNTVLLVWRNAEKSFANLRLNYLPANHTVLSRNVTT